MADLAILAAGTANEALSRGWQYQVLDLQASGLQFPDPPYGREIQRSNLKFNGGIGFRIVARLDKGERLFRFSPSSRTSREARASGGWWFDEDCYIALRKRSGYSKDGRAFRETARSNFAVLPEWGDMENCVTGLLNKPYWCFKGLTAQAHGNNNKIVGYFTLDTLQIFVPGGLDHTGFYELRDDFIMRSKY